MPATIVVPEGAPETKLAAFERFGGQVVALPYDDWWRVLVEGRYEGADGLFVHPVDNREVMAGNGTIGLELLEDLPDLDAVVVPYGGGGLLTGIASAVKAQRPGVRFYSAEPETGAPASAALAAGEPGEVDVRALVGRRRRAAAALIPAVWEHASELLDGAFAGLARRGRRRRAPDRRARPRDRGGRRRARRRRGASPARPAAATSSASSRAGTSTRSCSAGSSPAKRLEDFSPSRRRY